MRMRIGLLRLGVCIVLLFFFLVTASASFVEGSPIPQPAASLKYEVHILPPPPVVPDWIHPSGYNDPENAWENEPKAFDGYVATKATCLITDFFARWTPWIELTLSQPINCTKIRFYAWYDELHCNLIDIDLYYSGSWHHLYNGGYADREWVDYSFNTLSGVTKARVRFYVQRWVLDPVVADLHEFKFYGYYL